MLASKIDKTLEWPIPQKVPVRSDLTATSREHNPAPEGMRWSQPSLCRQRISHPRAPPQHSSTLTKHIRQDGIIGPFQRGLVFFLFIIINGTWLASEDYFSFFLKSVQTGCVQIGTNNGFEATEFVSKKTSSTGVSYLPAWLVCFA